MFRLATALVVILLGAPVPLTAQQVFTIPLDSGTLVRLRLSGELVEGRLVQPLAPTSPDIRFCRYPGNPCFRGSDERIRTLPTADIQGLEVQNGTRWARGALIGAVISGFLSYLTISFSNALCDDSRCVHSVFGTTALGALFGAGWGVLFGSTHILWRPAP